MLENNVNNQSQIPQFKAVNSQNASGQPVPMQAVNPELLKQNVQDSYVSNRVSETTEDPKGMLYTGLLAIPSWFAIAKGMDKFAEKTRGDYDSTIYHKVGQFGDDLTDRIKGSRFGKSSFAQSLNNGYEGFKRFIRKNIVDRFRVTRAFAYTPSKPENPMVLTQADGMLGFFGGDYPQNLESFLRPTASVDDLVCYGAEAADINKYKTLLSKAKTPQERALILEKAEFECLSKYSRGTRLSGTVLDKAVDDFAKLDVKDRIARLKNMKAFELGFDDLKGLEDLKANIHSCPEKIIEASSKANKKMFARAYPNKKGLLNWLKFKFLNRDVYASEFTNKMAASIGNMDLSKNANYEEALRKAGLLDKIPKSALGRFLNKCMNVVLEGATNRVAGGKLIAIMQAAYFADVLYKSMKAEGASEKMKSFAERFTEMIAFFVAMPMSIKLMHKVGGLQYIGMGKTPEESKKAVETYRTHLNEHDMKSMSGKFANKAEWKVSDKALRDELNAGVKNPFLKLLKKIGRIVTVGLEQIRPYDAKDIADIAADGTKTYRKGIKSKIKDLFRHPKFGLKQMAGYPMRIILGMMIILPFLSKIAVKCSHLIFGKPKNSLLDEGKEKHQEQAANPQQTQIPQQLQQNPAVPQNQQQINRVTTNTTTNTAQSSQSPSNLLNRYKNGTTTTTTTTTTQTVSSDSNAPQEPVRTYIPSPVGVQIVNQEDSSGAQLALQRADSAEKLAMQTLKMG